MRENLDMSLIKERGEEKVRIPTFVEMATRKIDEEAKTVNLEIARRAAVVTKTSKEQPWLQNFVASVQRGFDQLISRPGRLGTIQRRLVLTAGLILAGILAKEGTTFLLNHFPSNRLQAVGEELNLFPPVQAAEPPIKETQAFSPKKAYPAPKEEQPVLEQVKKPRDFQVGTSLEIPEKKAPEVNLSRDYVPRLIKIKPGEGIKTTPGKEIQAHPQAAEALEKLFAAAQKDGLDDLSIGSGYRSYDYQSKLYQAAVNKYGEKQTYVAAPGKSQHQTGKAFDFTTKNIGYRIDTDAGFEKTPAGQWLLKNASRFGFVMSYSYEPWHFMYLGETKEPLSEKEMKKLSAMAQNPSNLRR